MERLLDPITAVVRLVSPEKVRALAGAIPDDRGREGEYRPDRCRRHGHG